VSASTVALRAPAAPVVPWLFVLGGLAAMYGPSYWAALHGLWQTDDFGHGPIVLVVTLWLFWQVRHRIADAPDKPAPWVGGAVFVLGLLLYCFGRALEVSSVEFLSQIFVVAGSLLLLKGWSALRVAWFPVLYLVFMVPLPASLVDAVTGPLKQSISFIVVDLLYATGYPIARAGVVIAIGPYQLLVADACSGLNSMFSLSAVGTLFMYLMARKSRLHNAIMLASIVPIAFIANIVRVIALVLVTYHFGDEAGQGFLHGAAGIVLMLAALAILFAFDALLGVALGSRQRDEAAAGPPPSALHKEG